MNTAFWIALVIGSALSSGILVLYRALEAAEPTGLYILAGVAATIASMLFDYRGRGAGKSKAIAAGIIASVGAITGAVLVNQGFMLWGVEPTLSTLYLLAGGFGILIAYAAFRGYLRASLGPHSWAW